MKYLFNNARNCLRIFLRNAGIEELWVPYELCPVVFKAAKAESVNLKFYHIDKNFVPSPLFPHNAFILYPNYFGVCDSIARALAEKYPNLIYDAAHSFFSEPLGVATIYSARKFFPVADGGILVTQRQINTDFTKENDSEDFSTDPYNFEYEKFLKNELRFERNSEIKLISDKSRTRLSEIDFNAEKLERTKNFWRLHEKFAPYNELRFTTDITAPMVYPLKMRNAKINNDILILKYNYMKDIIPLPLKMAGDLPAIQKLFTNII